MTLIQTDNDLTDTWIPDAFGAILERQKQQDFEEWSNYWGE